MSYRASYESYLTNKLQYVQNKAIVELKISDHFGWYMGGIQVFREKMINYYQIFLIIEVEIQTMVLEGLEEGSSQRILSYKSVQLTIKYLIFLVKQK